MKLRERRKALDISIEQAAIDADMSAAGLYKVESGLRQPSFDSLPRIAKAYRMTEAEVLAAVRETQKQRSA